MPRGVHLAAKDEEQRLLQGYNLTYNARRQWVLNGRSPDDVVRERPREKPQLANFPYHPPDPRHVAAGTAEAQRGVISAKEMSQSDNSLTWHRPYTDSDIWKLATANISRGVS